MEDEEREGKETREERIERIRASGGMLGPEDLKSRSKDETEEERIAREKQEKKDQELLLKYLEENRISKVLKLGPIEIEVSTNLLEEDILCQHVANDEGYLISELRCLNAVVGIKRIVHPSYTAEQQTMEFIDFKKLEYGQQKEKLLNRYNFFKPKGRAIMSAIVDAHLVLEQKIETITTAERLKNW